MAIYQLAAKAAGIQVEAENAEKAIAAIIANLRKDNVQIAGYKIPDWTGLYKRSWNNTSPNTRSGLQQSLFGIYDFAKNNTFQPFGPLVDKLSDYRLDVIFAHRQSIDAEREDAEEDQWDERNQEEVARHPIVSLTGALRNGEALLFLAVPPDNKFRGGKQKNVSFFKTTSPLSLRVSEELAKRVPPGVYTWWHPLQPKAYWRPAGEALECIKRERQAKLVFQRHMHEPVTS